MGRDPVHCGLDLDASKLYSLRVQLSFTPSSSASGNLSEIFYFFCPYTCFLLLFHTLMMCMQRHVAVKSYSTNFSLCSDFLLCVLEKHLTQESVGAIDLELTIEGLFPLLPVSSTQNLQTTTQFYILL